MIILLLIIINKVYNVFTKDSKTFIEKIKDIYLGKNLYIYKILF